MKILSLVFQGNQTGLGPDLQGAHQMAINPASTADV